MPPSEPTAPSRSLALERGDLTPAGLAAGMALRAAPIVGAVALLVYVRTMLPGIAFGDWGEMQTVPHVLGVAHPTGYPTYILVAWLAELVPLGSVAFRANLLSAICVSIAVGTLALIAVRLGVRPLLAAAAALAFAVVGTVWAAATVAEVNPLHLALIALLIHRALVFEERRSTRDLAIGGLLVGLALGNHLLTIFTAPFVALFVVWAGRRELRARPWLLVVPVATGILGSAVYLYIPIAAGQSPPLPYNNPVTFDAVFWLVSGTQFRGQFDFFSSKGPGELVAALPALWDLLAARATPVFPLLGLGGLAMLVVRRPAIGLTCAAMLLTGAYIWANYLRLEHYLLVPWLLLGIGAAVALEEIARLAVRMSVRVAPRSGTAGAPAVVGVIALACAVVLGVMNWSAADRSDDRAGDDYVAAVMDALPANAAILSIWDTSTPLWYGKYVERLRPDVLVVDDTNIVYEGWGSRERRIASLICARPVFIVRLGEGDLAPTRLAYRLDLFMTVRVAWGGPTAVANQPVYRVEPRDPSACPG